MDIRKSFDGLITIDPGITQFYAEDIYPPVAVKYSGNFNTNAIARSGRIPDDNYRICLQLVNPTNNAPLTTQQPQCSFFNITDYQAPTLISPRNGEVVVADQTRRPVFLWTPLQPSYTQGIVTCRLQVMEVLPGQEPGQAYRTNQPIVEKDYKGITNIYWPVDFALPDAGMQYVWSVTALDDQERSIGDNDGRSGYFIFNCKPNDADTTSNSYTGVKH